MKGKLADKRGKIEKHLFEENGEEKYGGYDGAYIMGLNLKAILEEAKQAFPKDLLKVMGQITDVHDNMTECDFTMSSKDVKRIWKWFASYFGSTNNK